MSRHDGHGPRGAWRSSRHAPNAKRPHRGMIRCATSLTPRTLWEIPTFCLTLFTQSPFGLVSLPPLARQTNDPPTGYPVAQPMPDAGTVGPIPAIAEQVPDRQDGRSTPALDMLLLSALKAGNGELARRLLTRGGKTNSQDSEGRTSLHWVAKSALGGVNHATETAALLLAGDADVNAEGPNGWTPLHFAVHRGSASAVRFLLHCSADISHKNRRDATPLLRALEQADPYMVDLLSAPASY